MPKVLSKGLSRCLAGALYLLDTELTQSCHNYRHISEILEQLFFFIKKNSERAVGGRLGKKSIISVGISQ